ncbi:MULTISPECIES: flagellar basal body P-ring protein FlgI [Campylobacter]|uniref:flagellar basal body P-ring protein FlgI n=1 Tax=Campylobacter TaxID=194 RepID=UPI000A34CE2A|nr:MULTISPECIES: flagellar basal body P-ring protein FlgI [unclassified Campylobacter]MBE6430407.1 flagellar basal body P-ring protein FlgI [Campylobacter sp.]MBQ8820660.1 flagellar basal body P-ring protein FlgI [Campylobacter sp.]
MRAIRLIFISLCMAVSLQAATIKELASVVGVRDNQLIGYGLVVGLNGTGDGSSSEFTIQSLSNMLQTVNVKVDPDDIKSKNTAAVMVTAKLPPFARQGDNLDVTVSSIGDAKNLIGGTLLLTALKGVDGDIYALAQGALTLGGSTTKGGNHPTVATIMSGALVEKEVVYDIYNKPSANLSLKNSSFQTAIDMQNAIIAKFGSGSAMALDPRTISITKPERVSMVEFLASVLDIKMDYKAEEKIIIDERTGTIISGVNIKVEPVIISHGAITIQIDDSGFDPAAPSAGDVDVGNIAINTNTNTIKINENDITVANITRALNKLGATPKEIIAIIENLKRAGAIHAGVEVI